MTEENARLGEAARTVTVVIEDLARRARDAAEARPHLVAILAELGQDPAPGASVLDLAMTIRVLIASRVKP